MDLNNTNKYEYSRNKKGFTLIEVIVAVGIFALVMMVAIGAVLAIVGANKKAQSLHNVINSFNLAIETMVRDMRTGYGYQCGNGTPVAVDCIDGTAFAFTSTLSDEKEVTYAFNSDEGYITKQVDGEDDEPLRLTSSDVFITKLSFTLTGVETLTSVLRDFYQPKVLVIIQGEARLAGEVSKFNIQTLVTQRRLDI